MYLFELSILNNLNHKLTIHSHGDSGAEALKCCYSKAIRKNIFYFVVNCIFITILSISYNTVFSEGVGGIEKNHILDYFYFFDCSLCDGHRKH